MNKELKISDKSPFEKIRKFDGQGRSYWTSRELCAALAAGSYDAAKETERDILICDENGFAQTKDMPYGIYTVKQTSGWDGRELMKPFDVFISADGQTYRYLINNANFESYIKIVKKDAETGKTIPYAGAGFQIYDPNDELVTMTFTYPEVTTIDTFYTTADGCCFFLSNPKRFGTRKK